MAIYRGGRSIYGEAIGILLLDTRFPRIPGDIGNASTFDFPVRIRMVPGATPQRIVLEGDESVMPEFVKVGKELEAEGVRAITTSCGYLTTFQEALINAVKIPVFTSSLLQVPMVSRMLPRGKKVGILTIDSRRLNDTCLRAAGITSEPIVIMGSAPDRTALEREFVTVSHRPDRLFEDASVHDAHPEALLERLRGLRSHPG